MITAAIGLAAACGGGDGAGNAVGEESRRIDSAVDLSGITSHPELYIRSRTIPSRLHEKVGCSLEGQGGSRDRPRRFVNFVPERVAGDPGPPTWTEEPDGDPDALGTYEVTSFPCEKPTPKQVAAAQELVDRSLDAAIRNGWFDVTKAEADGFHIGHPGERVHYVHDAYMTDGEVLAPDKPEFLVVYESKAGERLLGGFMYMMPEIDARGPEIGGPLTVWHYHIMELHCWSRGLVRARPDASGACAVGSPSRRTPEMLHVWFLDRKNGPFASDMNPPADLKSGASSSCHGLPSEDAAKACEPEPGP